MLRLTLDANVLHALLDPRREFHATAVRLFELAERGRVQLAVTSRIRSDIPREPLRSRVAALPVLPLSTFARHGGSRDSGSGASGDLAPTPAELSLHDRLMTLLFPLASRAGARHAGRLADVEHLVGHVRSGNDYFVSDDKALHGRAAQLAATGIRVIGVARAVQLAEQERP
jgi:hypothetical protein